MSEVTSLTVAVPARPPLKWVGGKAAIVSEVLKRIGAMHPGQCYFEPFLGGGAVFFALRPYTSVLSDVNAELANVFRVIQHERIDLAIRLSKYAQEHNAACGAGVGESDRYYYGVRALYNDMRDMWPPAQRAAAFLYLNRAGYNGLYRVNQSGRFNVPVGRQASGNKEITFDIENIAACARALNDGVHEIFARNYDEVIASAQSGDVVYFDPPYDGTFASYASDGFGEDEQRELGEAARGLVRRGVRVIASNADTPLVREIWDGWNLEHVTAPRSVGGKGASRVSIRELIISVPEGGIE